VSAVFRVDASTHIGSGHVMRCITLAKALQPKRCVFVCQNLPGHLQQVVYEAGFECRLITATDDIDETQDARATLNMLADVLPFSVLVVDHYALGSTFCKVLHQYRQATLVIDDLANRPHHCDFLLDQNLFTNTQHRYQKWVSPATQLLLGPRYALLRDEFYQRTLPRQANRVLVCFGGADELNMTGKTVTALQKLKNLPIRTDIVVGGSYPWLKQLQEQITNHPEMTLHHQCDYMARLMQQATLMVSSGGTIHWERCISGLPGIVITIADNQRATTEALANQKACWWLGDARETETLQLSDSIESLLSSPSKLQAMAVQAQNVVPRTGGAAWVANQIRAYLRG